MAITEIPRSFLYECDLCNGKHKQENAGAHYTDSRPPHWSRLIVKQTAYDFQGAAVADASLERLLCDDCTAKVIKAIGEVKP